MRACRVWIGLVVAVLGCGHASPTIRDANLNELLGGRSFAGKWRCVSVRAPGRHWYERRNVLCNAETRHGTTRTLAKTFAGADGEIGDVDRVWWNRDSTEWMSRRDSLVRAVLARLPNARECHGAPTDFARPQPAAPPGTIRESRAWRAPGYDVEIAAIGPASSTDAHGGPLYTLTLDAIKAPGWTFDCATEAQLSQLRHPDQRHGSAPARLAPHS